MTLLPTRVAIPNARVIVTLPSGAPELLDGVRFVIHGDTARLFGRDGAVVGSMPIVEGRFVQVLDDVYLLSDEDGTSWEVTRRGGCGCGG